VADSIETFGFINPVVIDENQRIIAGHGRVLAAKLLNHNEVPTVEIRNLSEAQLRTYMIADNKLTDNSSWDEGALRIELEYLSGIDLDFELEITGFSTGEIDLILEGDGEFSTSSTEDLPPVPNSSIVQRGDIFELGRHRLICGDCRDSDDMAALMGNDLAAAVCTDAPYNVSIKGHVLASTTTHPEFSVASGELTETQFIEFLTDSMSNHYEHSKDGSVHFFFMDWRHIQEILTSGLSVYDAFLNMCVWVKTNGGMGSFYRSQHELVFVFKKGKTSHTNNIQLGKHGRNRTNVWCYAGMNSFGVEREEALVMHPTVKPVAMISDAIMDVTRRGEIVLDGFIGSGTTLIAAHECGRIYYGVELEPRYVEVAIRRFQNITDEPVIHFQSGLSFDEFQEDRLSKIEEQ